MSKYSITPMIGWATFGAPHIGKCIVTLSIHFWWTFRMGQSVLESKRNRQVTVDTWSWPLPRAMPLCRLAYFVNCFSTFRIESNRIGGNYKCRRNAIYSSYFRLFSINFIHFVLYDIHFRPDGWNQRMFINTVRRLCPSLTGDAISPRGMRQSPKTIGVVIIADRKGWRTNDGMPVVE